jgi:class 3 adenylate cyclase/FixJ family two-component response regulator
MARAQDTGWEKIILVDDNPANLRAGKNVLAEKYEVFTAPSAEKMFGLLEEVTPALILLDIEMPEMNGYGAIKLLKGKSETRDIPVIFLTGKTDSDNELEGLSLGAIDYITKPFVPTLLLKRIEVHLLVESQKKILEAQQRELQNFNDNLQKMVEEKTQKVLELHETFGRYLSDEIVKQLLESPEGLSLGGKKRFITILMSDLRGFTLISERMKVEDVVTMLNHYFGIMVEVIHRHSGTVIEFIGDAILAVFGAPVDDEAHPDKAVACALEMQLAMEKVNRWNRENDYPPLEMGIGINTGETIVGNIGSPRAMKYNVIGNNVNLCSRVESYTIGGQVLLSEYTAKAVKAPMDVAQISTVYPKGVQEPILIYNINGLGEPFNLAITMEEIPLARFEKPVPVLCYQIRDKQVDASAARYGISGISEREARIVPVAGENKLAQFDNVKLCIEAGDAEAEVLAKVTAVGDGEFTVCFTTGAAAFCEELMKFQNETGKS